MKRCNAFTEEINEIFLYSNDDKRMQYIDLMETYAHGMSEILVFKKKEFKCNKIIKQNKNA